VPDIAVTGYGVQLVRLEGSPSQEAPGRRGCADWRACNALEGGAGAVSADALVWRCPPVTGVCAQGGGDGWDRRWLSQPRLGLVVAAKDHMAVSVDAQAQVGAAKGSTRGTPGAYCALWPGQHGLDRTAGDRRSEHRRADRR
jgi:hypothetical protein